MKTMTNIRAVASVEAIHGAGYSARDDTIAVLFESKRWEEEWPDAEQCARIVALNTIEHALARPDPALDVCIVLADDAQLRVLNARFRNRDGATNVLAFPLDDSVSPILPVAADSVKSPKPIGDVVIAYETVLREADEQEKSPEAHLAHLVTHGVLHLLGFDHRTGAEFEVMSSGEKAILAGLGYSDPYASPDPVRSGNSRGSSRPKR